jgi:citrate lyase subunit beta / citryl-CoA lyase
MRTNLDFLTPLFVPGNRPDRFTKAAQSGADAIILDLEDAIPAAEKDAARRNIAVGFTTLPVLVRINAVETPWFARDLEAVLQAGVSAIMIPKAEIRSLHFQRQAAHPAFPIPVVALVETAQGLVDAAAIAALPGVERLAFGSIDYCADLGCAHTRDALLAARSSLVLASRLAGILAPIDGVTTAIDETDRIRDDARHARDLGFGGKLCIHPKQIEASRAGLAPDQEEIAWAKRIVASGDGAVAVDGAMVDEPVRIRARNILRRAETR